MAENHEVIEEGNSSELPLSAEDAKKLTELAEKCASRMGCAG
ncbi:spore coat protein [Bacillus subtilis]|nr:spore coat protein [Bacillus subtilis]